MKRQRNKQSNGARALSLVLLATFLFSQAASYLTFKTQQFIIKEEVENKIHTGIPDAELMLLDAEEVMRSVDFAWEEWGMEFYYNGHMYDLAKTETIHGKLYFKCVNDAKEMELICAYKKMHEHSSNDRNTQVNSSLSFALYDVNPLPEFVLTTVSVQTLTHIIDPKVSFGHTSILAPPPIV